MDSKKRVNSLKGKIVIIETNKIDLLNSTFQTTVYVTEIRKFISEKASLEFVKSLNCKDVKNVFISDNRNIIKTNVTHLTKK